MTKQISYTEIADNLTERYDDNSKKIYIIKTLRDVTGLSLRDSKLLIDNAIERLPVRRLVKALEEILAAHYDYREVESIVSDNRDAIQDFLDNYYDGEQNR